MFSMSEIKFNQNNFETLKFAERKSFAILNISTKISNILLIWQDLIVLFSCHLSYIPTNRKSAKKLVLFLAQISMTFLRPGGFFFFFSTWGAWQVVVFLGAGVVACSYFLTLTSGRGWDTCLLSRSNSLLMSWQGMTAQYLLGSGKNTSFDWFFF